jgi:hypothetical protein
MSLSYDERRRLRREINDKHERWQGKWIILLIIAASVIPVFCNFVVAVPVDTKFNQLFKGQAIMLDDMATFEGMKQQLKRIRDHTEQEFAGFDPQNTFDTPWYWGFTYDRSLQAQYDYYTQLDTRFDEAIFEKNQILSGEKVILSPYAQWYQETLESLRDEIRREGGILWVTEHAWYLHKYPVVYWFGWIYIGLWVICGVSAVYVLTRDPDYGDLE